MIWIVSFIISVLFLIIGVVFTVIMSKTKESGLKNPFNTFFASVFASSSVLFFPVYLNVFCVEQNIFSKLLKVLLLSVHNTMRLFILDGDFTIITEYINKDNGWIYYHYTGLAAVLFVIAPILTFGFVLTFFKNFSSNLRYLRHQFAPVFVFSELNERSVVLAEDLSKNNKKRLVVFTNTFEDNEKSDSELIERAKNIGAILFKNNISVANFFRHSKKSEINFFIISDNESENLNHVLNLIDKYRNREKTSVFVFSTDISTELVLNNVDKGKIKVRRIQEVQSLINRNIYDNGYKKIFESAKPIDSDLKMINAVIIGMGLHGTEMTKSLAWVGQMHGYRIQVTSYDIDKRADQKFTAICPDLLTPENNTGIFDENESCYKITIKPDVDVTSKEFFDSLDTLGDITYVFVSLGSDEMNIKTAINVRSYLLRNGSAPVIDAVVFDTKKKKSLDGITNHSNQSYDINFIGDMESSYCEDVVMGTDIEKLALARHMMWGQEDEFWNFEYNYRSSIASAIHKSLKIQCGVPGISKSPDERSDSELDNIRKLEHRRWNAYMRSEGFVYSETRNNLAKTHHLIKRFDELPLKEQIKDDE